MNAELASRPGHRIPRRIAGVLLSLVASVVGIVTVSVAPAAAATTRGSYTAATCGWLRQDAGLLAIADNKISQIDLPRVTATSGSRQLVWMYVEFMHPVSSTTAATYRAGWFYTYAVAGRWTTSWTSYMYGTSGWTLVRDEAPQSGYTGAELTTNDTYIKYTIDWMTGSSVSRQVARFATNPRNVNNSYVCNGGGNFAWA
jgi:hypothetical protein